MSHKEAQHLKGLKNKFLRKVFNLGKVSRHVVKCKRVVKSMNVYTHRYTTSSHMGFHFNFI